MPNGPLGINTGGNLTELDPVAVANQIADTTALAAYAGAVNRLCLPSGASYVSVASTATVDNRLIITDARNSSRRWVLYNDRYLSSDVFGIVGDGTTDDTAALQLAANACNAGFTVIFPRQMTCKLTATVIKPQSTCGLNWQATGGQVTLNYAAMATGAALKIKGGSGTNCVGLLSGFTFVGSKKTDLSDGTTGIEIADQNGQHVEQCYFSTNLYGVVFHNESSGGFTELCTLERCNWLKECQIALRYKRTSGNNSFHQSGLVGVNYINTSGDTTNGVIIVDNGCLPYNSPLCVQTWFFGTRTFVQNKNTGNETPYFHGNLSFEHFSGSLTIGSGQPMYFVGGWLVLGDFVSSGTIYQCRGVVANKNNSYTPYGLRWNGQLLIGNTALTVMPFTGAIYKIYLTIVGNNYDYRAELTVDSTGGSDGKGEVFINAVMRYIDPTASGKAAAYGKPTISTDTTTGKLILTNANYPASGSNQLTVYATINQIGDAYYGNYPAASF